MKHLTLQQFRDDPEAVAERVFGPDGLLAAHVADFRANDEQREYAKLVARAAARGFDSASAGRLTLLDAATGIGKTLPYATMGLLAAVLTGKRFMVATYTRALMHQLVGKDGRIACQIVHELTGKTPSLVPRRSRSGFASPSRAQEYAKSIRAARPDHAAALDALADFTQRAVNEVAAGRSAGVVADLAGLPESFAADQPDAWEKIIELPADKWRLTAVSPEPEQELWRRYGSAASGADGIVVTHAAVVIDQSLNGRVLDHDGRGYALVVIDEAHALERAAALAFQTKRSVSEILRDAVDLRDRLADEWFATHPADHTETRRLAESLCVRATRLVERMRDDVKAVAPGALRVDVHGDEPWVKAFGSTLQSLKAVVRELRKHRRIDIVEFVNDFDVRAKDMEFFWACILYRRKAARQSARRNARPPKGLFRPVVVLAPVREDPSFMVVPVRGQRIISRLWWRGAIQEGVAVEEKPIKSDSVIFTSATLGNPGKSDWDSFETMAWTLGIDDRDRNLINRDLCRTLEPAKFGDARFFFPHPSAPLPNELNGDANRDLGTGLSEMSARYAALGIDHVARTPPGKRGTTRVFVTVTNSSDPQRIVPHLPPDLRARCIVRNPGAPLRECLERFRASQDGILFAYGAWEGVDMPGTIDYQVFPRLPFPPPADRDEPMSEYGGKVLAMKRTLRQGLGRGIRKDTDEVVYVFTDPRIGLPEEVAAAALEVPHGMSSPSYLSAIPRRFRDRMNEGKILPPLPEPVAARVGKRKRA